MNRFLLILAIYGIACFNGFAQPTLAEKPDGTSVVVENIKVEHSGSNILIDMSLNMNLLHLSANDRYVFTPVIESCDDNHNVQLPQIIINGRRQDISFYRSGYRKFADDAFVVKRKNNTEQSLHYKVSVPYFEWMKNSNLEIMEDYCGCGDILEQNVSVLHKMRTPYIPYLRPAAEAAKVRHEEGKAFIDFPVDQITLYPNYRNNPVELNKIINTINIVKQDKNTVITSVSIHGYASPESPYEHNAYLAENRAKTLKDYVAGLVKLNDSIFSIEFTPEDWDGLRTYVEQSSLPNRNMILDIINDNTLQPDDREWRIKLKYPDDYAVLLRDCYPALRHSDYVVTYTVRPFSVEEAKEILKIKPQQLSLEEMFLVAQSYEPGSRDFNYVMDVAVRMFPNNETANINAACTMMQSGDLETAQIYLNRAGDSPQALHAKAVLAMIKGDEKMARELLQKAIKGGCKEASENLDLLELY